MFRFKSETSFDVKTLWNAFMKKLIICVTLISLMSSLSLPVFAAENNGFSYSGNSYSATVKYGVNFRDKNDNIIRYLDAGTCVYVLGVSSKDSSRVVIKYENTIGTVLTTGVKKTVNSGLAYSGKSYYGKVKYYLNMRDENYNIIEMITQNEVVRVLGTYKEDPTRVVIEWHNTKGTVLKSGLAEVNYEINYSGKFYYAVTKNGLNLRDTNGNLICYIPKNNLVCVKGVYAKDGNRVVVTYNGTEGNVLKDGVKEIKDAIFVNIPNQKVTLIKDNKIIAESKCVTGTENKSETPCGAFKVTEMKKNKTLRGQNYDGSWYAKPVDYWLRFYNGCGFHDAKWRASFGGTIYKTSGSYGCVNLPHAFAKTLYENSYVGMPVYIA